MRPLRALLTWRLLTSLLLFGCGDESGATQLTLRIESDLTVPDELDRVTVAVVGQERAEDPAADLREQPLPRTLTLVHAGGPLGPLQITVRGFLGTRQVVQKLVTASFAESGDSQLTIVLERSCADLLCGVDQTCEQGRCVALDPELDAGPLTPRDTGVPRDASRLDAESDAESVDAAEDAQTTQDAMSDATTDAGVMPTDGGPGRDAGDATVPDANTSPAGAPPVCTVTLPVLADSYQVNTRVALRGSCRDPETGELTTGLSWSSQLEGLLGSSATVDATMKLTGMQRLSLCAVDPRDTAVVGCSIVEVEVTSSAQPTVSIVALAQAGVTTPPFQSGAALSFSGAGSGAGVTLTWTDDLQGELGSGASVSAASPLVGRHTVTLTVRDRAGVSRSATRAYTVVALGESSLLPPYLGVNQNIDNAGDPEVRVIGADPLSRAYVPSSAGVLFRFDATVLASQASVAIGQPPLRGVVQDIHIAADKNLSYLATAEGLTVCSYAPPSGVVEPCTTYGRTLLGLLTQDIRSVLRMVDSQNRDTLLVGTNSGLFLPDNVNGSTRGSTILRGRAINDMVAFGMQAALATDNGLYLLTPSTQATTRLSTADGLAANQLRALSVGTDGSLWLATSGGLTHYEPAAMPPRWTSWNADSGLGNNSVNAVAVQRVTTLATPRDIVWVGTNAGLVRLDASTSKLTRFTIADGLPSNEVLAAQVMANGHKLFGTTRGLARFVGP